jgi:uncharacterized protein (DUF1499 family)
MKALIAILLIAVSALFIALIFFNPQGKIWFALLGKPQFSDLDFATMQRLSAPRDGLMCPEGLCKAKADVIAPSFNMPAVTLQKELIAFLNEQPRLKIVHVDERQQFIHVLIFSRWLNYPDLVSIKAIPITADDSTLAIYSRAMFGYYDFNVNRQRLEEWRKELTNRFPAQIIT